MTCLFVTQFEGPIVVDQVGGMELWRPWVGSLLDAFFVCVGKNGGNFAVKGFNVISFLDCEFVMCH